MDTFLFGRNAVRASLEAGNVKALCVASRFSGDEIVAIARKKDIPVRFMSDGELTNMAKTPSHQGFVAMSEGFATHSLDEIIVKASHRERPLLVLLDGIEDPQNLGAILRCCDAFGADGLVMKKRGEAPLNATVAKVSTGAINYVDVAVVANLSQAIAKLKASGYWIVAADASAAKTYREIDYRSPIALVIGSEGKGIAPLVLRNSDFIVKIPMVGHVNSLNAAVAAGILLAHIASSRV
jgi:23S rRNA (guanosine2251-2'-O)-methyltransferase